MRTDGSASVTDCVGSAPTELGDLLRLLRQTVILGAGDPLGRALAGSGGGDDPAEAATIWRIAPAVSAGRGRHLESRGPATARLILQAESFSRVTGLKWSQGTDRAYDPPPQGCFPAAVREQQEPGEFPVPVLSMVCQYLPGGVP